MLTNEPYCKALLLNVIQNIILICYLLDILSLGDPFISYFDSRVAQTLDQVSWV